MMALTARTSLLELLMASFFLVQVTIMAKMCEMYSGAALVQVIRSRV